MSCRWSIKSNILTWNVRGLGSRERRCMVRELAKKNNPDIISLQETKLMQVDKKLIMSVCNFHSPGWIALPSVGASGGVLLIWNEEVVLCHETKVDKFSVSILAALKGENQRWVVTGVYGPPGGAHLEDCLVELGRVRDRWEVPWCVGGDFNKVLFMDERNRASRRTRGMDMFCDFVDQCKLINLPILRTRFTWSNFQDSPALSKLGHFLISVD